MTENEYIQLVNELRAELDDCYSVMEESQKFIEELKLKIALANSSHQKKSVTVRQAKEYESQIAELQQCVDLFSVDYLSNKADEMDTLMRQVINFRHSINEIKNKKRVRESEIESLEDTLDGISVDVTTRFIELHNALEILSKSRESLDETTAAFITNILTGLSTIRDVLGYKDNKIAKLNRELNKFKHAVVSSDYSMEGYRSYENSARAENC